MTKPLIGNKETFLAFQYQNFRRFIFSKFLLTLALQIQFVVLSWQVYEITHDPLSLGFIGLAEAIPAVGLALYGGYISDRNDRRKILVWVHALLILCTAILAYVSFHYSDLPPGGQSAFPFYMIMFGIGILRGFYSPAQFPLMTQVVPREAYANSAAWNSTFWHIAVVLGSSGGGLMLGFFGKNASYVLVLIFMVLGFLQVLRIPPQPVQEMKAGEKMMSSIREGLRFVFSNQAILGALSLDLIAVLFGGATALLPIFASDILHVGEKGFGFLRAAPFAGSVMMALYMTKHPPLKRAGKKLLYCVAGFSACMIAFALSRNFYLSLFILALSGAFDNVSVVIRSLIMQLLTPDHMRGRVSSVSTMFISSSNEIGAFESGFAAKLLGLVPSVIIGGTVALGSVGAAGAALPELRKLDLSKA
ncbi:MAG TPA: MFS transporter [Bacteroidia bacterium]|nr:MFS transporter [Bacteroidia bacterium]